MITKKIIRWIFVHIVEIFCIVVIAVSIVSILMPDANTLLSTKLTKRMETFDRANVSTEYQLISVNKDLKYDIKLYGKWKTKGRFGLYNELHIKPDTSCVGRYVLLFTTSTCGARYVTSRHAVIDLQTDMLYLDKSLITVFGKNAFNSFRVKRDQDLRPINIIPNGYPETAHNIFLQEYLATYY
jgi:hypothetical protein